MKPSQVKLPKNRSFGIFFTLVFSCAALWCFYHKLEIGTYTFIVAAAVLLIVTLTNSERLLPLNRLWMHFGLFLHSLISPLVLGFLFFGLFTPVAFLLRLRGRDELKLAFEKRHSHWIVRDLQTQQSDFKRQF